MIKSLLEKQQRYLSYYFDHLDISEFEKVFEIFKKCKGLIILTGIGKSGLVAEKIAATMTSTNTRALYISPVNALHGDIGIVTEKDVFVVLSKSGESDELLRLLPAVRNKGATLVSVVSNPNSRLVKACDINVTLPLEKELCPFDMAPTTSAAIQMLFGDVMAVSLMQQNQFTIDDFATNHPAGQIGRRITLKVKDLMIVGNSIPLCHKKDKLVDILVELSDKRCGAVLVIDEKKSLVGIFTDGDLRRALQKKGSGVLNQSIDTLMTKDPRSIGENVLIIDAIKIMEGTAKNEVTVLPVIDEEKHVIGLIKLHDIIQTGA